MKKILVVDGNSIINRAFYGIRPLTTTSGKHTNAIYGMVNIISKQLSEIKPDYAAVAFDLKAPTFRHKLYDGYKAGRRPTPEELLSQFPDAKEVLKLMGLKVLELAGYEADDIQGTVANMAYSTEDTESYILSGDRDLLQLIGDKVTVLLATNSDTLHMREAEFLEKYKVAPEAFVDMKALMGDSSDNIPGVSGIGEKTAATLIENFGSLDGIYENIDDKRISKGVREKLLRDKENAYLSKVLAKIDTEVPLNMSLEELRYEGLSCEGLYAKFKELELNSFIVKFGLSANNAKKKEENITTECGCTSTTSFKEIAAEELASKEFKRIAVQAIDNDIYIYINEENFKLKGELKELTACLCGKEVICYDAKTLLHKMEADEKLMDSASFLDLMLYEYALNPGTGNAGVEALSSMFLSKSVAEKAPAVELYFELEAAMRKKIEEDGLDKILYDLELPLIKVLTKIENNGFKINPEGMLEFSVALEQLAEELTTRIYMLAGKEFNINSPKQLGEVLFVDLGLPYKKKKTKTGYSTDAETLEELRATSPIIDDILEYRQVTKLRGTYASALPEVADKNNRIHTDFKQALTATGRLSSADPNLQNIPIRTKMGRQMRKYFVAEEGYTLVDADYSQIELRLLAHISGDYNMQEAFRNGEDIHTKTAAAVFGLPEEMVNEEMRKRAKAVNFGIVYGISGFSLAKDIGTGVQEATRYIKNYMMNYPDIDRYLEDVVNEAKDKGYTATPMGRRRYIPELNSSNGMLRAFGKRIAMNAPIQGAAADIMKIAMINVDKRLSREGLDARIVMQVHDELIVEVREDQKEACKMIVKEEMESAAKLDVPLTVEVSDGKNWLEQN